MSENRKDCDNKREVVLDKSLEVEALKFGDFTLASGAKSSYYFDGRRLSLDPHGAHLLGNIFLDILIPLGVQAIGGPTVGADPIVAAVALSSYQRGTPVSGFIVRSQQKRYGTQQKVEGPLKPDSIVAIVDDVCTTGGSIFKAIDAVEAMGCKVAIVLAVLDRARGGAAALREKGYTFDALLAANEEGIITAAPAIHGDGCG